MIKNRLEVAFDAVVEAFEHGKGVLLSAWVGARCGGKGDIEERDSVVRGEKVMRREEEDAVGSRSRPFCLEGAFLEGREEWG